MFSPTQPYSDATKTIYAQLKTGTAFDTQIVADAQGAAASMSTASLELSKVAPFTDLPQSTTDALLAHTADGGALTGFVGHVQTQLSDLPKNISLYTSKLSLDQGTGDLGLTNLCSGINDFFGSIMGEGKKLLDKVTGAIGDLVGAIGDISSAIMREVRRILGDIGDLALDAIRPLLNAVAGAMDAVKAAVAPLLDGIQTAIGAINGFMKDMTDMIAKELNALGDAISDLFNMSGAMSLQSLFSHPCAKTLLGAVGTGGLIAALAAS